MQAVLDCLTPVEDSPPSPWPRPPEARPPEALPNIVSFSQALLEYWRVWQLMGALKDSHKCVVAFLNVTPGGHLQLCSAAVTL
eukprot:1157516-Pelagomonas_calceolata.AAC.4